VTIFFKQYFSQNKTHAIYYKYAQRKENSKMKVLDSIALALLGGLNWLLVGLFEFDLVATIAGGSTTLFAKIIYVIVGICAIYCLKFFVGIARQDNVNR